MKIILLFCEAKCPYKSVLHSISLKIKLSTISAALPWLIELSFPLKGALLPDLKDVKTPLLCSFFSGYGAVANKLNEIAAQKN